MFIVIGIIGLTLLASNYERCGNTNYAKINAADLNSINMRDLEM